MADEPLLRSEVEDVARGHLRRSLDPDISPADARDLSVAAAALGSVIDELPETDERAEFLKVHWSVMDRWWRDIETLLDRIYAATTYRHHGDEDEVGEQAKGHEGAARFVGDRAYYRIREGVANEMREFLEKLPPDLRQKWWDKEDEVRELARKDRDEYESQEREIAKLRARVVEAEARVSELEETTREYGYRVDGKVTRTKGKLEAKERAERINLSDTTPVEVVTRVHGRDWTEVEE